VQRFTDAEGMTFVHAKNVVGFDNLLPELASFNLVVSEYKLRGLDGDGIFERYKRELRESLVPFMIIDNFFSKEKKFMFLQMGIAELLNPSFDPAMLVSKANFYRSILQNRIENRKKVKVPEYKIPVAKRIFDLVVAGGILLVIFPLLILVIIAIKLESKGPFWYKSKRVGTGYKVFDFYKFRSMYTDADQRIKELAHLNQYAIEAEQQMSESKQQGRHPKGDNVTLIYKDGTEMSEEEYLELKRQQAAGTFVKFKNDPRITRVGHFIRNTSIDELPQLINVLKGDMSIVGNRPLPLYEAEQLTSDDWGERFLAPAGITGLWQVEKRGKGEMSEEERKALDNRYAKNFSFWNDIKLILKTVPALFQKENV
jgi:lipopolysaccharide/colanic/teichoic acid biosynthesis glycosyltransferase